MRTWKGWTHQQRMASYQKTKQAIKEGIIPKPSKCERCGQTRGIIQYHNHDYSDPIKFLEQLCRRCHMVLHSEHHDHVACGQYWADIRTGYRYPPVFRHNFEILARDHGIRPRNRGRK